MAIGGRDQVRRQTREARGLRWMEDVLQDLRYGLRVLAKNPAFAIITVLEQLKCDGQLSKDTRHRTSKYLNNIIEADHGALKQVPKPTRGFQTMKTARATIKGFEIMRMIRRGHCLTCKRGVRNGIRFVNRMFEIAA